MYSLCDNCPVVLKIILKLLLIEDELAQPFEGALNSNDAMSQGDSDITQHCTVSKVALQTAHREFLREELQQGIGNPEVPLAILEVDRIHLVGHCTRSHLAGLDLLFEVLHRDIHPEVAVEIDNDGIDATNSIEDGRQRVVVTNLSRILFALQAQFLTNEAIGKRTPVVVGISHMMSVEVTCSTAKLSRKRAMAQRL